MTRSSRSHAVLWLTALLLGSSAAAASLQQPAPPRPDAVLSRARLPAQGEQESFLTVSRFGRYALTVPSPQGVALALVDRMAGPGEPSGTAGEKDGRLDVFLDRGEYKVNLFSHDKGSG